MERDSINDTDNIYFRCRKEAAMCNEKLRSRESASEALGLSPSTLANYELGTTKVVPPEAVVLMADLYKAPELKAFYCANVCAIGKGTPIATKVSSIELVTVRMIKAFSQEEAEAVKKTGRYCERESDRGGRLPGHRMDSRLPRQYRQNGKRTPADVPKDFGRAGATGGRARVA